MFAAFRTGVAKEREGEPSARFFRRAHALASALIERGPPGARALVPMHLVRARACVLGRLECEEREVTEDLTWVLVRGDGAERRLARRMLEGEGGREGGR